MPRWSGMLALLEREPMGYPTLMDKLLHRDLGLTALNKHFDSVLAEKRKFTEDLAQPAPENGLSSMYSYSSSSVTGPDGVTKKIAQQRYHDSTGRKKSLLTKQLGDRHMSELTQGDQPATREFHGIDPDQLEAFEKEWQAPMLERDLAEIQQNQQLGWNKAWDPLVAEMSEFGFGDREAAKEALSQSEGDIKKAVKAMVEKERNQEH